MGYRDYDDMSSDRPSRRKRKDSSVGIAAAICILLCLLVLIICILITSTGDNDAKTLSKTSSSEESSAIKESAAPKEEPSSPVEEESMIVFKSEDIDSALVEGVVDVPVIDARKEKEEEYIEEVVEEEIDEENAVEESSSTLDEETQLDVDASIVVEENQEESAASYNDETIDEIASVSEEETPIVDEDELSASIVEEVILEEDAPIANEENTLEESEPISKETEIEESVNPDVQIDIDSTAVTEPEMEEISLEQEPIYTSTLELYGYSSYITAFSSYMTASYPEVVTEGDLDAAINALALKYPSLADEFTYSVKDGIITVFFNSPMDEEQIAQYVSYLESFTKEYVDSLFFSEPEESVVTAPEIEEISQEEEAPILALESVEVVDTNEEFVETQTIEEPTSSLEIESEVEEHTEYIPFISLPKIDYNEASNVCGLPNLGVSISNDSKTVYISFTGDISYRTILDIGFALQKTFGYSPVSKKGQIALIYDHDLSDRELDTIYDNVSSIVGIKLRSLQK